MQGVSETSHSHSFLIKLENLDLSISPTLQQPVRDNDTYVERISNCCGQVHVAETLGIKVGYT